jgi:hypothetical protein
MRGSLDGPRSAVAYHVVIRTLGAKSLLCCREGDQPRLTPAGNLVERCWHEIPAQFSGVVPDAIAIRPDHIEGLLLIPMAAEAARPRTVEFVIGAFKSTVSSRLERSIWESGCQSDSLPDTASFEKVRQTILEEAAVRAA